MTPTADELKKLTEVFKTREQEQIATLTTDLAVAEAKLERYETVLASISTSLMLIRGTGDAYSGTIASNALAEIKAALHPSLSDADADKLLRMIGMHPTEGEMNDTLRWLFHRDREHAGAYLRRVHRDKRFTRQAPVTDRNGRCFTDREVSRS